MKEFINHNEVYDLMDYFEKKGINPKDARKIIDKIMKLRKRLGMEI